MTISFEVIPAIDLKGGKCVRLQEGIASRATEYGDDPLAMALHWQEQGATRLHLVDLDGAFQRRNGPPCRGEINFPIAENPGSIRWGLADIGPDKTGPGLGGRSCDPGDRCRRASRTC